MGSHKLKDNEGACVPSYEGGAEGPAPVSFRLVDWGFVLFRPGEGAGRSFPSPFLMGSLWVSTVGGRGPPFPQGGGGTHALK